MTPVSGDEPETASPMFFGFLEDSGWYKANYRMVENYSDNKGDANYCKQDLSCSEKPICKPGTDNFVTKDYRGIGFCSKDKNSGCPKEIKYENRNIANPKGWSEKYNKYGASWSTNSIITIGLFYYFGSDSKNFSKVKQLPVEAYCDASYEKYTLRFINNLYNPTENKYEEEDVFVDCNQKGEVKKFNCKDDYCSEAICHDPDTLCTKLYNSIGGLNKGKNGCDYSCLQNGRCHPGSTIMTPDSRLVDPQRRLTKYFNNRLLKSQEISRSYNVKNANENTSEPGMNNHINYSDSWKCWCYTTQKEGMKCPSV